MDRTARRETVTERNLRLKFAAIIERVGAQRLVAHALDTDQSSVSKIVRGETPLTPGFVTRLVRTYPEVTPEAIAFILGENMLETQVSKPVGEAA